MSYVQKGKARSVYIRQNEGSLMDVEHADMVEKQLDALIQRRARKGDVDPDELDPGYMESVRAYEEKRRQMARVEWHLHHTAQAERLRRTLEELASHHESEAARLMEATDERSLGEQSTARQRLARQGDKPQAYEIPRPRIRGVGEGAQPCE